MKYILIFSVKFACTPNPSNLICSYVIPSCSTVQDILLSFPIESSGFLYQFDIVKLILIWISISIWQHGQSHNSPAVMCHAQESMDDFHALWRDEIIAQPVSVALAWSAVAPSETLLAGSGWCSSAAGQVVARAASRRAGSAGGSTWAQNTSAVICCRTARAILWPWGLVVLYYWYSSSIYNIN